jgi:hypothetical protein
LTTLTALAFLLTAVSNAEGSRQVSITGGPVSPSDFELTPQRKCLRSGSEANCIRCAERDHIARTSKLNEVVNLDTSSRLPPGAGARPLNTRCLLKYAANLEFTHRPLPALRPTPRRSLSTQDRATAPLAFPLRCMEQWRPGRLLRSVTRYLILTTPTAHHPTHQQLTFLFHGSLNEVPSRRRQRRVTAESLATAFGGVRAPDFGSLPSSSRFGNIQDPLASGLLIEFEVDALFALWVRLRYQSPVRC